MSTYVRLESGKFVPEGSKEGREFIARIYGEDSRFEDRFGAFIVHRALTREEVEALLAGIE